MKIELQQDQVVEALRQAKGVYVWHDDLFGEMGCYLQVRSSYFIDLLKQYQQKGFSLEPKVTRDTDTTEVWIGEVAFEEDA